ncbi:MAG TPA: alkaline phosphatase family protein [Gemmatimonadales bacterium]|nr:alkaline phosphatase family protein [Gemmatimonadales bacterium]
MRRVIFVLADGLRPDAISRERMPALSQLRDGFAHAPLARTIRPSATVAALASLATGVSPRTHRLIEPGLGFLPGLRNLRPVARELARNGVETAIATGELATGALPVAWALASTAGVRRIVASGTTARETAKAAHRLYLESREGLVFVYLPDCDRAGHAHGWMSEPYLDATRHVDAAIHTLATHAGDALLIITADHGGGGVRHDDHDEPHPVNDAIPLVFAGPRVTPRYRLAEPVSILDLPPTILWWFGCEVPACYEGQPLYGAFECAEAAEPVPA